MLLKSVGFTNISSICTAEVWQDGLLITSFRNVLQACQGGLLSAGMEEAGAVLSISAGSSHLLLEVQ